MQLHFNLKRIRQSISNSYFRTHSPPNSVASPSLSSSHWLLHTSMHRLVQVYVWIHGVEPRYMLCCVGSNPAAWRTKALGVFTASHCRSAANKRQAKQAPAAAYKQLNMWGTTASHSVQYGLAVHGESLHASVRSCLHINTPWIFNIQYSIFNSEYTESFSTDLQRRSTIDVCAVYSTKWDWFTEQVFFIVQICASVEVAHITSLGISCFCES